MKYLYNEKGLTLLELVTTLTIIVFLLGSINGILGGTIKIWQQGSGKSDLQQNARIALNMLEMDIRRATKVYTSSSSTSLYIQVDNEQLRYYLNGKQLLKSKNGQGNNPVAYDFSKLQFVYHPNISSCTLIEINMEFKNNDYVYELSSKVNIRAASF